MAQSVRDVMTDDLVAVPRAAALQDAAARMRDANIGDVIVLDGDDIYGVVTDRDIAIRAVAEGRDPSGLAVGDICSGELVTVSPDDSTDDAVARMRSAAIRRLPVIEDGKPVGIVSIGDLAVELDRGSALGDISAAPPNR